MRFISLFLLLISSVSFADNSPRLISIDGALTEIIYQLGAEKNLVAVDSTSTYPQAANHLANVGYLRALSTEGVLSVKPTQIITTKAAGPAQVLVQLQNSGIKIDIIDQPYSIAGVKAKILAVGDILNKQQKAQALVAQLDADLQPSLQIIKNNKAKKLKALFFLGMQGNQLMAAGKHSQADALLSIANIENAGASFHGYKPLSKEAVLTINPDIIIVAQTQDSDESVLAQFAYTQAFHNGKILVAGSDELLGFGPRFAEALKLLVNLAYSE